MKNINKTSSRAFIDPVCLMEVDSNSRDIQSTYKLRTYHFCAPGCKTKFDADPERYLSGKPSCRKSWWARYLDRLGRATGGRSMKCH